jgi:hypothetical protein
MEDNKIFDIVNEKIAENKIATEALSRITDLDTFKNVFNNKIIKYNEIVKSYNIKYPKEKFLPEVEHINLIKKN